MLGATKETNRQNSHIISGNIISRLGVKYLYIISFSVFIPITIAIFVFVRETTFSRKKVIVPIALSPTDQFIMDEDKKNSVIETKEYGSLSPTSTTSSLDEKFDNGAMDVKLSWKQHLKLFRGRVTDRNIVKAFFQPFPLMVFPSVLFSTIVNGGMLTWAMISGIISHQVLLFPPYNLQPDVLAYIGLPGSVVSLIASLASGFLSDWMIKKMAKRNNGVYEPEFRLIMMIPAVLFSTLGFLITGPLYARHAPVPQIVISGLLFHMAGPFASSACITYIFDTMQNTSTEAFVATSLFKHIFTFLATEFVPQWFADTGPIRVYQTLAVLNLSFASMGLPMYIFGKRLRGAVARNKFLTNMARNDL